MTKFECAEQIVGTLDADTVKKLAAKHVAGLMRQPRYDKSRISPDYLIREAFEGIKRLDKKEMDFALAWSNHRDRI